MLTLFGFLDSVQAEEHTDTVNALLTAKDDGRQKSENWQQ